MEETVKIIETYNTLSNLEKKFKRNLISEVILANPVPIPPAFKGNFGEKRSYEIHPGTDIPVPSGTPIKAPADGIVITANPNLNDKCGGTIDIDYGNGLWSRFCHVKRLHVKKGDKIFQGQVVGLTGGGSNDVGRGNSGGPHLHFSLTKDGKKVDPVLYMDSYEMGTQNLSSFDSDSSDESDDDVSASGSTIGDIYLDNAINRILSSVGVSESKKLRENISKIKKLLK